VADTNQQPGAHLASAFAARGSVLDAEQGRRALDVLLRLFELGALVFWDEEGPTVYNMGPSVHEDASC
jgi:hypothetical protein